MERQNKKMLGRYELSITLTSPMTFYLKTAWLTLNGRWAGCGLGAKRQAPMLLAAVSFSNAWMKPDLLALPCQTWLKRLLPQLAFGAGLCWKTAGVTPGQMWRMEVKRPEQSPHLNN